VTRSLQIVLHGGDGKLDEQIALIVKAIKNGPNTLSLRGKSVGYVVAALEPISGDGRPIPSGEIENTFKIKVKPAFDIEGISKISLIYSNTILSMLNYDIVVISGGDTHFLLDVLRLSELEEKLIRDNHSIKSICGISAGAIALVRHGISIQNGMPVTYTGLGLLDVTVIPHCDKYPERKKLDANAIALGAQTYSGLLNL
jgi:hypothetical protein